MIYPNLNNFQLIIKLDGIKSYANNLIENGENCKIELHNIEEPPISVLDFLNDRQVHVVVGIEENAPAKGRKTKYPNLSNNKPDINTLQRLNAETFRKKYGTKKLDYSLESLGYLDQILEQTRFEAGILPDETDEEFENGDVNILASAYVGEVIKREIKGEWVYDPKSTYEFVDIIHFRTENNDIQVSLISKVMKYLKYGTRDSVKGLAGMIIAEVSGRN